MSQKSHEPQFPYHTDADPGDEGANPLDRVHYGDFEFWQIEMLREQVQAYQVAIYNLTRPQAGQDDEAVALRMLMLLADVKVEFEAVYAKVPPIFREQWARVARLLGVE